MSIGLACKFYDFSISYTIHNIPLSMLYLPSMLLNPCTFLAILPTPSPSYLEFWVKGMAIVKKSKTEVIAVVKMNGNENFKVMTRKSQRRSRFEKHFRMQEFFKKRSKGITKGVSIPKQAWTWQRTKNCKWTFLIFPDKMHLHSL